MTAADIVGKIFDRKLRRFILVGLFNTAFGTGMMFGFYRILGMGYWGSSGLSYFIASFVSYLLNKNYTFSSRAGHVQSGVRFAVNIGVCYLLAYLIAKPAVRFALGIVGSLATPAFLDQLAMLAGMVLFTAMNYLGQRFFVFPEKHEE
jgi:putative flippase GtrA